MNPTGYNQLFAPWRIAWVTENRSQDECVFCSLAGAESDRENRVIARSNTAYIVLNIAPYSPGHVMVIPVEHTANYIDLDSTSVDEFTQMSRLAKIALDRSLSPDGYSIGMNIGQGGGASITEHLHRHIVPRWRSDTQSEPTCSNVELIPLALDEIYNELHSSFAKLPGAETNGRGTAIFLGF